MRKETISDRFSKLLSVGEVSKLTNVSVSALHFYEKIALIEQPVRSRMGYRLYGQSELERLDFIKKAKTLGFKLDEIRQIIDESKTGDCCESVRSVVDQRLKDVDEKIANMKQFRDELTSVVKNWNKKNPSDSVICGLIEESDLDFQ